MVSIVLVSHSHELSEAVKSLAEQQIQGRGVIAAVGGSDNPFQPYGTDPVAIADAIESVYSSDGVLVLMDLGSAVVSGKVALDLLTPEQAHHVILSVGPFIEGAMAAAVQASIGMDLAAVAREAEEAMQAKRAVLVDAEDPIHQDAPDAADQICMEVRVVNPAGLHFGPAARFLQAAAQYQAHVTVSNLTTGSGPAEAVRFNQLLGLAIEQNHRIRISATGLDAERAVHTLADLVAHDVAEAAPPLASTGQLAPPGANSGRAVLVGLAASHGVAVGEAVVLVEQSDLTVPDSAVHAPVMPPEVEWERCNDAIAAAAVELESLAVQVNETLGMEQAMIFRAHALLLQDLDLLAELQTKIMNARLSAPVAVQQSFSTLAHRFHRMAGATFNQRAADIMDVGRRVLRLLLGELEQTTLLPANAVIVAHDLSPSRTAGLDRTRVAAFCTAAGGPNAHTAILARSMGIPAVVGLGEALLHQVQTGDPLAIDGFRGQVVVAPDAETYTAFVTAQQSAAAARTEAWHAAQRPTCTRDGLRVEVVANLGAAADATIALQAGAEGVGLLRTEFLFQERSLPPSEEEQYTIYRQVAEQLGARPLIIRTLDVGGDKPAPYLQLPHEANPFLGWRAIRVQLAMPEFFKTQLRALLRAAVHGSIHIMLPMIATADEIRQAQAFVGASADELAAAGVPHRRDTPLGIMVEIPSAAMMADQLAPLVDFFSIGTNDLTQYTFAADRGNAHVAALADPLHPAVLRQIDAVIRAAHAHGRWCGLCGEMAAQPEAIPILLGLGLDEFSMAPASIPATKQLIGRLTVPVARRLAQRALNLSSGDAVRALVEVALRQLTATPPA
ncbi:MAG: phosphoenolpyruvate--protein phosphotransferase [Anaerolineales bacterium]|nr:phosphoenolpyruvate--protein phosphotransferase [Anaerolineales bacterium]